MRKYIGKNSVLKPVQQHDPAIYSKRSNKCKATGDIGGE